MSYYSDNEYKYPVLILIAASTAPVAAKAQLDSQYGLSFLTGTTAPFILQSIESGKLFTTISGNLI